MPIKTPVWQSGKGALIVNRPHICNVCGKDITDMTREQHYFGDGCLGSWRSVIIQEQVGTETAIVSYHCGDCGAEW